MYLLCIDVFSLSFSLPSPLSKKMIDKILKNVLNQPSHLIDSWNGNEILIGKIPPQNF